jgi:hypothetical protein
MNLAQARERLDAERVRAAAAQAQASARRLPPTPRTPPGGWLGWAPPVEPAKVERERAPSPAYLKAKATRDAQVEATASQLAEFQTWRPTPTPAENAAPPGGVKQWDLNPIERGSFDATESPGRPVPPAAAINTSPPVILPLDFLEVGHLLAAQVGTWTSGPASYARQWFRGARPIIGAINPGYTPVAADEGYMIGLIVTATTNAGGAQNMAAAVAVGPILPATTRSKAKAQAGPAQPPAGVILPPGQASPASSPAKSSEAIAG